MSDQHISELLKEGRLTDAIAVSAESVKKNPNDEDTRILFIELLCINNEFERADQQLTTLIALKPALSLPMSTWRQLVHAAQKRHDVFALNEKPDLIESPTQSITLSLDLLVALKANDSKRVSQCLKGIDRESQKNQFSINQSQPFLFRDCDDVTANIFEVLATNGKYFWIDFNQVIEINIHKPERLLEVLWRKATISLTNGTEGEVYLPAIYPTISDELSALGRKTDWEQEGDIFRGIGLRTWLSGDAELSMNDQTNLELNNISTSISQAEAVQG